MYQRIVRSTLVRLFLGDVDRFRRFGGDVFLRGEEGERLRRRRPGELFSRPGRGDLFCGWGPKLRSEKSMFSNTDIFLSCVGTFFYTRCSSCYVYTFALCTRSHYLCVRVETPPLQTR